LWYTEDGFDGLGETHQTVVARLGVAGRPA